MIVRGQRSSYRLKNVNTVGLICESWWIVKDRGREKIVSYDSGGVERDDRVTTPRVWEGALPATAFAMSAFQRVTRALEQ